ncbi:MAG: Rieske 2Fe-2S domain-containing protein, partial [Spongiibacter sp.]
MSGNNNRRLADGSTIADLIDLDRREVQLRTLSDREIYEWEQEKIFGKTWLLLGHESEIPNDGDFVQRFMGDDSVIVARHKGEVFVSLNVCPHRGMKITTQDAGTASIHKCIYHGWAFRGNGDFLGSPVADQCMHGTISTKEELALKQARVTLYGGLIFATWNID